MEHERSRGWQTRLSRRIALAACPPRDRAWVEALFAELDAVDDSWSRLAWTMGAARLVAASTGQRVAATFSGGTAAAGTVRAAGGGAFGARIANRL